MSLEWCWSQRRERSCGRARRPLGAFVASAVIAAVCCLNPQAAQAITFGELDQGRHPATGALVQVAHLEGTAPDRPVPRVRGSGCLIHPRIFLTAGHVTAVLDGLIALNGKEAALEAFAISLGEDAHDSTTWLEIAEVFTHPGFRSPPNSAGAGPIIDVGLIILREPVQDVEPVTLATEGYLDALNRGGLLRDGKEGSPFTNVGYGTQLLLSPSPTLVSPDGLRRTSVSSFQSLLKNWLILSQNPHRDNAGTGFGDSGGPTIWLDPDSGAETVVAITSRGDAKTISTGFTFRIDTKEVLDFIAMAEDFANL